MARIRVYNKALKQYGTIEEEEFNSALFERGEQPSSLEKIAEMLPTIGGWGGAIAGTPAGLGMLTGPAGQMIGYGAGETMKRAGGVGYEPSLAKIMEKALTQQAPSGFYKGMATQIPYTALTTLLHPIKSLGQLREKIIGGITTPTATLEEESLKNLYGQGGYQYAPPEVQRAARARISQFLSTLAPAKTAGAGATMRIQQPSEVGLSDIYKGLKPFEEMGGAYERTSVPAAGTELASRAVRQYVGGELPVSAQAVNQLMSRLYGLQRIVDVFTSALARKGAYRAFP